MAQTQGMMEFTFDKGDEGIGAKSKRWKGEKDRTYRFSFINWQGLETGKPDLDQPAPRFVGAQIHYLPNVGYFLNKGPEYTKIAGEPPKTRIATAIVVWPTDNKGQIDKGRLNSGDAEVRVWLFSGDKYAQLKQIHAEFPLGQHDINVTCTDPQYQKITITPCRENLLRKLLENPKAKSHIDTLILEAQNIVSNIQNEVGREMTLDQIRDKMVGGTGAGAAANVGSPADNAVASGQIDDIVDGLLDG